MYKSKQKTNLHPNSKHRYGYDFDALIELTSSLKAYIVLNPNKEQTIDFSNPKAVKTLNLALLRFHYGIDYWDIPEGHLCPPIPGRADYIHYVSDLLSADHHTKRAKGGKIKMWDVGVGANCIYPLLAYKMYGWSCTGSDISDEAVANAQRIIKENGLNEHISIHKQPNPDQIFQGINHKEDYYDVVVCNPPFHESEIAVKVSAQTKWNKLGKSKQKKNLNFGGIGNELWCKGGELAFIKKIIAESAEMDNSFLWYTTLVSKQENCDILVEELANLPCREYQVIPMSQGQKKSRILAWTFLTKKQRKAWANYRWK